MRWPGRAVVLLVLGVILPCATPALQAQEVVSDALSWFSAQTVALEYSNASALRALPNYKSLRARYLGRRLVALEAALAKLGIHESDINEMVIGWQIEKSNIMRYEGIASGNFDESNVKARAAANGIAPHPVGGSSTYCFAADPNRTCVAVVSTSTGVFGPLDYLEAMLKARNGGGPGLTSNQQFTDYARHAQSAASGAPIWGVDMGPAVSQWFGAWMPGEKNLQMDWRSTFKDVQALSYHIQVAEDVNLNVKLDCASEQAASSVTQLLQGLKLVQEIAWRSAKPGQPDPFQNIEVETDNQQVTFQLTADYSALEGVGPLGQP